jgi:hypothetical protein
MAVARSLESCDTPPDFCTAEVNQIDDASLKCILESWYKRLTIGLLLLTWRAVTLLSAHIDLRHAVGITSEAHFVARQFRQASQARTGFREQTFH